MNRTALLAGAVLALSVLTASPALAQDDSNACDKARIAEGNALTDLRSAKDDRERVRLAAEARDATTITVGDITVVIDGEVKISGAERVGLDALKGRIDRLDRKYVDAVEKRKDKCDDPAPTSTVTTTPATPAPDDDVDCDEVSDEEAQRILDADRNDPNDLDSDDDGVACEEDVIVGNDDEVVIPSGGVNTGGGPA